jgi:hypothetical protein
MLRDGIGLSQEYVAEKLNITRPAARSLPTLGTFYLHATSL